MAKVFIAVPTFENIYPDTFKSIYGLAKGNNWVVFDFVRGYDCATARNNIAKQALAENAEYVLMVDSDIIVPGNAIIQLIEDDKDVIISACAHRASGNFNGRTSICKNDGEIDYTHMYTCDEIHEFQNNGKHLIQIHGGGMGCTMIKVDLFRRLPFPWFKWVQYDNGSVLSEDLYFCEQCKNAGIPIYTDTRVTAGHIFRQPIYV